MSLQVDNLVLGEGQTKICVPLTGVTKEQLLAQAEKAAAAAPDLVEWRADFYEDIFRKEKAQELLTLLTERLGGIPILFTFRTLDEGGNQQISSEAYQDLLLDIARKKSAALIDVEIYKKDTDTKDLIRKLHQLDGLVVASNHHFDQTPSCAQMQRILDDMEEADADILKVAVMPKSAQDVLWLLQITEERKKKTKRPIITMSMGKLGMISRISGSVFGSALTFASLDKASAPGQIPLDELRAILRLLE